MERLNPYWSLLLLCLTVVSFHGQAQPFVSQSGKFQVSQRMGCKNLTIEITLLQTCGECNMNPYGTGIADDYIQVPSIFTYDSVGTFWLHMVFGGVTGQGEADSIQITVLPNIKPAFELYSCGNNEVSVKITDTNYDEYVIDYSDGAQAIVPRSNPSHRHTFPASGSSAVSVRGRNNGASDNCNDSTQTINVVQTLPPPSISDLTILDASRIQLDFDIAPHILYRLEVATNGNTNFQPVRTLYGQSTDVVNNLRPDQDYYCFRLGAFDPCINVTNYSNIICSADLDLFVENNINELSWKTNTTGIAAMRLQRVTSETGNAITTTVTGLAYSDTDVQCGSEYCYRLVMEYPNGAQSVSLEKCGTAFSTDAPDAIVNTTAVVNVPGVNLEWAPMPGFAAENYTLVRLVQGTATQLGTTALPQFYDEPFVPEEPPCYQISYTDICGNSSAPSAPVCPIALTGTAQKDNTVELVWTAYTGWEQGVSSYRVQTYSVEGQLLSTEDVGTATTFLDQTDPTIQVYIYQVVAVPIEPGLPQAVSNPVTIIKDPNLFYPTGFTPNGDNLNDTFNVFGQFISRFQMSIFNRWGEMLYTTTDIEQGWDGTYQGAVLPEGTYSFVAEITDLAGRTFRKSGSFFLLRKGK